MTELVGLQIATVAAVEWVRDSLTEGSTLAMLMRERIGPCWSALLIGPGTRAGPWTQPLSAYGLGYRARDVDVVVGEFLRSLARSRLQTVVVEDDAARRGDSNLAAVAYVEDRVLRWSELDPDPAGSAALLRSSAYPLNAFVCRDSATHLKLEAGRELDAEDQASVVESTEVVIVSAYDAEAYVAVLAPGTGEHFE